MPMQDTDYGRLVRVLATMRDVPLTQADIERAIQRHGSVCEAFVRAFPYGAQNLTRVQWRRLERAVQREMQRRSGKAVVR